jgi:hypothetical protein
MYIIRDVMHCKPGCARPMVDKFLQLRKVMKKIGFNYEMRVMTDVCAERYWTVVAEMEVESLEAYTKMSRSTMADKNLQKVMKDYHELIDQGKREIYMLEK